MPPERKRMAGLREREVGELPPRHFANAIMASKGFVQSLSIQKRLWKHRGCINTISFNADGRLLLSGSDDRTVVMWNWVEEVPAFSFHTGHSNNVLHAQFMPFSDDRSIVTCAADGEVRHSQIGEGGRVTTDKLVELDFAFDLRGKDAVKLFKCKAADHFTADDIELFAIAIDPRKPCCFAVAGSDEYVRIYDARKICQDGNSSLGHPTEHFCPPHLIGENKDGITGLAYSQTSEILATYSHDNIYLFSREHGLHFNDIEVDERLLMDETGPLSFNRDKLPIPKAFKGHQNQRTIKGVNFLGPNCDYVTSGSDCGRIFIWRKKDGELIRVMNGDTDIVNCVEQHPSGIVVASSGIDNDVKIWEPGEGGNPSIAPVDKNLDIFGTYFFKVNEDMWLSSSSDSDGFIYNDDFDYVMELDDILYGNELGWVFRIGILVKAIIQ
ncbi:DDB1- and CUL4-associated factor 8 [Dichanthelium oligosanthes]|uniref:DDB1-and CUL4-associated factor 8 n=1 Tax=Dichanthelium oligosanthes TaxID=888268 RepID=A0A1E5VVH5_9POAL|nr:DDB1- and CUL4-associated factor 8 [Dichanthelium oligosanthes]